ncbi:MAG TPA: TlpA disulfide reductase family protein [Ramlibacter sp.]|nr:TlpA disulfide reductase family protein [Ramlibacter sp.]
MRARLLPLLLWLAAAAAFARTPGEVEVGSMLREVEMQGLMGPSHKLSDYRGKPLIINVWASYCGPCREEMGSLQRLAWRYGGAQFNIIGVSTDDYVDRAEMFLRITNTSGFSNFIDHKLMLENMLGANKIPTTLLVDGSGKVLARYIGTRQWDSPESLSLISKAFGVRLAPQ